MVLKAIILGILSSSSASLDRDPERGANSLPNDQDQPNFDHHATDNSPTHEQGFPDDDVNDENLDVPNNDIIHDVDIENTPEQPPARPRGYRFRQHISLSGFSTISSLGPIIRRHRSPPEWRKKLKSLLPQARTDLHSFIPNYRLTPIISSIVIPFSILLEIPGLTEHWYIRTNNNMTVDSRPNPAILKVGLAFSMTSAVIANVCLVLRFMEMRVKLMTLICVVFLTIHDVINIIAITIFGVEHRFDDGFTYGQPFWLTLCSTIASVFTNVTLILDLVRTPEFSKSGSGLTHKQRSLLIVVIILLCYIALGALINTILINLSFVDALYFSVVTIETIGFGDISPRTTSARIFSCFYATVGVLNVALMVGLMRDTVLETFEIHYRIRMRKLRRWRQVVSRRRRIEERWRVAIEWRLREANKRTWVKDACHTDTGVVNFLGKTLDRIRWPWIKGVNDRNQYVYGHGFGNHPHGMRLNLEALTPAQLEAAALEAGVPLETLLPPGFKAEKKTVDSTHGELSREEARRSIPLTHARLGRMVSMLSQFALAVHRSGVTPSSQPTPSLASSDINGEDDEKITQNETYLGTPQTPTIVPLFRRGLAEEYDTFRKKAKSEEKRAFYSRLFVAWVLFIVFWTIGSAIFMVTEGWSYGVAMYFCFVAFTTIGYGDLHPETPAGRSVFVVWALLGAGTMTILISVVSEAYSYRYRNAMHSPIFEQAVKRYHQREQMDRSGTLSLDSAINNFDPDSPLELHIDTQVALSESEVRARQQLEALPTEILQHVQSFREHVDYFVRAGDVAGRGKSGWSGGRDGHVDGTASVPEGMKQLLDDITGPERIPGRIKDDIMQDADARRTLLKLSIEKAIRQLNDAAEDALKSVKRRNNLATLHEQRGRRDLHREIQRKQSRSASELRTPDLNSPHPDKHVPSLPSNYERTGDVIPV